MANFTGRLQLTDEHGLTTTKEVSMVVDEGVHITTIAQITAANDAMAAFLTELDDIVDGVITSATLSIPVTGTALKTVAGEQGVAEGANLKLETLDNDSVAQIRPYWLPSAAQGIFNANFRTVDTGDADLLAWLGTFDANDVLITVSDGEAVTGIDSGTYATRRRSAAA
jgi:hypothetical protein